MLLLVLVPDMKSNSCFSLPLALGCAVKYSGYLEERDEPFCTNCHSKFPRLMKLGRGGFELSVSWTRGCKDQPVETCDCKRCLVSGSDLKPLKLVPGLQQSLKNYVLFAQ